MTRLEFTRAVRVAISKTTERFTTAELCKRLPKSVLGKSSRGDVSEFLMLLQLRHEVEFSPFSETAEYGSWKRTDTFKRVAGKKRRARI